MKDATPERVAGTGRRRLWWLLMSATGLVMAAVACAGQDTDGDVQAAAGEQSEVKMSATRSSPTEEPAVRTLAIEDYKGPELAGTGGWFNGEPATIAELLSQGQVVLIDFWTYTCINCLRTLPHLRDWHAK